MKLRLFAFLLILAAGCSFLRTPKPKDAPTAQQESESLINEALRATAVMHINGEVYCSAFVVERVLLTAYHCTVAKTVFTATLMGEEVTLALLGEYPTADISVLRAATLVMPRGAKLAPEPGQIGERAIVIGHPLGLKYSLFKGIVSHPYRPSPPDGLLAPSPWMQLDIAPGYGASGGGVFNIHGEVIGLISAIYPGFDITVASHWESIKHVLEGTKLRETI